MKTRALFVIESDPRQSGRPAEAVRMAAGMSAWKKVGVYVYLRQAAVLVLGEEADALVDGENYTMYLPILEEAGRPIYAQKGSKLLGELGQTQLFFEEISDEQLAHISATSQCLLHF
jgi:hypothetical protein